MQMEPYGEIRCSFQVSEINKMTCRGDEKLETSKSKTYAK